MHTLLLPMMSGGVHDVGGVGLQFNVLCTVTSMVVDELMVTFGGVTTGGANMA
jgi:hypothetical protein